MKVNIKKSKLLFICTKQRRLKPGNPELKLKLNNEYIECVKDHTILGLVVDNDLTWSSHINLSGRKLTTIIGLLWRNKDYLSYDMKIMFYNSFIVSRMGYCICVWGGAFSEIINKLYYKIQKHAAHIILCDHFETSSCVVSKIKMDEYFFKEWNI